MNIKFDKILGRLRESDVSSKEAYQSVVNFAALPDPVQNNGIIYLVQNATGIIFINFKQKGLYRSDGATWNYLGVEYDTTSLKIGLNTITASPIELTSSGIITLLADTINKKINIDASIPSQQLSSIQFNTLNNI